MIVIIMILYGLCEVSISAILPWMIMIMAIIDIPILSQLLRLRRLI